MNIRTRHLLATLSVTLVAVVGFISWALLSSSPIDAQAIIGDACKDAERMGSGLISSKGTETRYGETHSYTWDILFSNGDRSWHIEWDDGIRSETYFVGNMVYTRDDSSPGVWGEWTTYTTPIVPSVPIGPTGRVNDQDDAAPMFCGIEGLTDHKFVATQTVDGEEVKHFASSMDDDLLHPGDSVSAEFWITDSSQIKQFRLQEEQLDLYGDTEFVSDITAVLSRIGEPITITAPTIP